MILAQNPHSPRIEGSVNTMEWFKFLRFRIIQRKARSIIPSFPGRAASSIMVPFVRYLEKSECFRVSRVRLVPWLKKMILVICSKFRPSVPNEEVMKTVRIMEKQHYPFVCEMAGVKTRQFCRKRESRKASLFPAWGYSPCSKGHRNSAWQIRTAGSPADPVAWRSLPGDAQQQRQR